jgi:hypothetical protein
VGPISVRPNINSASSIFSPNWCSWYCRTGRPVEIEEEQLQGLSFLACRRLRTAILIPPERGSTVVAQAVLIDPSELDAAMRKANAEPEEASG